MFKSRSHQRQCLRVRLLVRVCSSLRVPFHFCMHLRVHLRVHLRLHVRLCLRVHLRLLQIVTLYYHKHCLTQTLKEKTGFYTDSLH